MRYTYLLPFVLINNEFYNSTNKSMALTLDINVEFSFKWAIVKSTIFGIFWEWSLFPSVEIMSDCNFVWAFNDAMEEFRCGLIQIKHIYAGANLIICCCYLFQTRQMANAKQAIPIDDSGGKSLCKWHCHHAGHFIHTYITQLW